MMRKLLQLHKFSVLLDHRLQLANYFLTSYPLYLSGRQYGTKIVSDKSNAAELYTI